jgi:hypothetical protein
MIGAGPMFKKIDLTIEDLDLSRLLDGRLKCDYDVLAAFEIRDTLYLAEKISSKVIFRIPPFVCHYIQISNRVNPHVDNVLGDENTSLNYYLSSSASVVSFWKEKSLLKNQILSLGIGIDAPGVVRAWDSTDGLELIDQFQANDNEAYLLDTTVIHSVSAPVGVRHILSWRWREDFHTVLDSIQIV